MRRRRVPPRPDVSWPTRRREPTRWIVAAVLATAAVIAGVLVVAAPRHLRPRPTAAASDDAHVVPTGPDGPYSFINVTYSDGQRVPMRWNPCEPIRYETNLSAAPPGMADAIDDAIGQATEASGISFRSAGQTSRHIDDVIRGGYFDNALRSVYRPVLIDVVTHRRFRALGEPRRVVAFAHPQDGNGERGDQYVAGYIVIDGGGRYAASGRWSMELIVLHELGHLLGLGHVRSPNELMYSVEVARRTVPAQISTWGPGDIRGLELLGHDQGCLEHVRVAR